MIPSTTFLLPVTLFAQCIVAQVSSSISEPPITSSLIISIAESSNNPSGSPLTTSAPRSQNATATSSSTTADVTVIVGPSASTNGNASATTSARARPSNTRPCNGHVEFCDRKFSNISMVVAHNSPFVRPRNAASNQVYPVLNQLNDGIRGLQFETQKPNSSSAIRLCHTSCDLLDVGTLESYLATVKGWLDSNPYEVIAIIMGNNNGQTTRIPVADYVQPFQDAGIMKYLWTPSLPSMNLTDWPSLSEMIIRNKRVVVMMDYGTDQSQVPWLLSEFNYQWETPFSPTDPAFPCTQQRPPNQAEDVSRNRMYMMNHNLNIEINLSGISGFLIPAYSLLDKVNAVSGNGSLGLGVQNCEKMWGRPPNWLLVDYYNFGNINGSVFQVAATANNVSYNEKSCCGTQSISAAVALTSHNVPMVVSLLLLSLAWL
ncbi:PLC-like phosphodiesterase [Cucurbitaria berberidis CBS 394.84]|uniref:PLC-like phosphodiesterase n=1 Tax=Cucurbitaria berberidis CBS 394.84 TaxID=1168544 RepID=A0A9P4GHK7_9PLEO|nr:PLC-like phosphodiesterase [Cucurbitaria berberidis CBS 394.84]KAF1845442.1 PLC-like phosphodiesterase [Cucurbitaria berberidis CBS 394.84]